MDRYILLVAWKFRKHERNNIEIIVTNLPSNLTDK